MSGARVHYATAPRRVLARACNERRIRYNAAVNTLLCLRHDDNNGDEVFGVACCFPC